jgi:hypothetical protein
MSTPVSRAKRRAPARASTATHSDSSTPKYATVVFLLYTNKR